MNVRVIAGELGGRKLRSHDRTGLRPTTDRVRESMFSMISARLDLDGIAVLDLYAGTGALGIEALSRGAATCHFIEADARTAALIRQNLDDLGLTNRSRVTVRDAFKAIGELASSRFGLVLADPPYAAPVFQSLPALVEPLLLPGGLLVLEHPAHVSPSPGALEFVGGRSFGETAIDLLRRSDESLNEPEAPTASSH